MKPEFIEDKTFVNKPNKKVTHIDIHFDDNTTQTYDCKDKTYVVIPYEVYRNLKEVYMALSHVVDEKQSKGL